MMIDAMCRPGQWTPTSHEIKARTAKEANNKLRKMFAHAGFHSMSLIALPSGESPNDPSSAMGAHDNYGMAMGHECIPNPLATELAETRRKKESAVKESEAQEDALAKNIASRYNVPVWVSVRDGRVEVEAQR